MTQIQSIGKVFFDEYNTVFGNEVSGILSFEFFPICYSLDEMQLLGRIQLILKSRGLIIDFTKISIEQWNVTTHIRRNVATHIRQKILESIDYKHRFILAVKRLGFAGIIA
jgi:hypothetical protein